MNDTTIELIELFLSCLTPLLILIIGASISKNIEKYRSRIDNEISWQSSWAQKLFEVCMDYNACVNQLVVGLSQYYRLSKTDIERGKSDKMEELISDTIRKTEMLDWEIKIYAQFAETKRSDLLDKWSMLFNAVSTLYKEKKYDLEKIRSLQIQFNEAARLAHGEILRISSNKPVM